MEKMMKFRHNSLSGLSDYWSNSFISRRGTRIRVHLITPALLSTTKGASFCYAGRIPWKFWHVEKFLGEKEINRMWVKNTTREIFEMQVTVSSIVRAICVLGIFHRVFMFLEHLLYFYLFVVVFSLVFCN